MGFQAVVAAIAFGFLFTNLEASGAEFVVKGFRYSVFL
jgi:hypothetical protein